MGEEPDGQEGQKQSNRGTGGQTRQNILEHIGKGTVLQ